MSTFCCVTRPSQINVQRSVVEKEERQRRIRNSSSVFLLIPTISVLSVAFPREARADETSWADWMFPTSYPLTTTTGGFGSKYATGVQGSVANPQGGSVTLTLSGEINSYSSNNSTKWGNNSGGGGYSGAAMYTQSSASPTAPLGSDMIAQTGYTSATYQAHTLTFSQTVTNAVLGVWSLGSPTKVSSLVFS